MALLAVHQPDPLSFARLTSALGSAHELVPCRDWAAFWEAVRRLPLDGCVVDVYRPTREVGLRVVQRLRKRRPTMAIVVYADFTGREMDLFALGRLKVDGVLLAAEHESVHVTREVLADALASSLASCVLAALSGRLPAPGPDLLRWAIENAHKRPAVAQLAEAFSLTPRSLARVARRAGLPSPGRLLLWGRLFRAAQLLEDRGTTVERAALVLGYSTGAALGRALRLQTGHAPGELRRRGGLSCVLNGFARSETRKAEVSRQTWWRSAARPSTPLYPRAAS